MRIAVIGTGGIGVFRAGTLAGLPVLSGALARTEEVAAWEKAAA